jgi:hypothetical protein
MVTGEGVRDKFKEQLEKCYITAVLTPITYKIDNETGDKIKTEGTPVSIKIKLNNPDDKYNLKPQGMTYNSPSVLWTTPDIKIERDYLINYQNNDYRIDTINMYSILDIDCFQKCLVYMI